MNHGGHRQRHAEIVAAGPRQLHVDEAARHPEAGRLARRWRCAARGVHHARSERRGVALSIFTMSVGDAALGGQAVLLVAQDACRCHHR
jgi:hypothetical protein